MITNSSSQTKWGWRRRRRRVGILVEGGVTARGDSERYWKALGDRRDFGNVADDGADVDPCIRGVLENQLDGTSANHRSQLPQLLRQTGIGKSRPFCESPGRFARRSLEPIRSKLVVLLQKIGKRLSCKGTKCLSPGTASTVWASPRRTV